MTKSPNGWSGDQCSVRAGFALGERPGGPSPLGVQSMGTRVLALRLWGAYGELRRLTLRGDRLSSVRVARSEALTWSSSLNHRRRWRGRSGGERPRNGAVHVEATAHAL